MSSTWVRWPDDAQRLRIQPLRRNTAARKLTTFAVCGQYCEADSMYEYRIHKASSLVHKSSKGTAQCV
jgi:hypothetical protein